MQCVATSFNVLNAFERFTAEPVDRWQNFQVNCTFTTSLEVWKDSCHLLYLVSVIMIEDCLFKFARNIPAEIFFDFVFRMYTVTQQRCDC